MNEIARCIPKVRREWCRRLFSVSTTCLLMFVPMMLPAVEWTGRGQTTAWSDAGNWSEEKIPGPTGSFQLFTGKYPKQGSAAEIPPP